MKNGMMDLNDHLFCQLERLSDEDLKGDALKAEIERSNAITKVSTSIINNAALALKAQHLHDSGEIKNTPKMLEKKADK